MLLYNKGLGTFDMEQAMRFRMLNLNSLFVRINQKYVANAQHYVCTAFWKKFHLAKLAPKLGII